MAVNTHAISSYHDLYGAVLLEGKANLAQWNEQFQTIARWKNLLPLFLGQEPIMVEPNLERFLARWGIELAGMPGEEAAKGPAAKKKKGPRSMHTDNALKLFEFELAGYEKQQGRLRGARGLLVSSLIPGLRLRCMEFLDPGEAFAEVVGAFAESGSTGTTVATAGAGAGHAPGGEVALDRPASGRATVKQHSTTPATIQTRVLRSEGCFEAEKDVNRVPDDAIGLPGSIERKGSQPQDRHAALPSMPRPSQPQSAASEDACNQCQSLGRKPPASMVLHQKLPVVAQRHASVKSTSRKSERFDVEHTQAVIGSGAALTRIGGSNFSTGSRKKAKEHNRRAFKKGKTKQEWAQRIGQGQKHAGANGDDAGGRGAGSRELPKTRQEVDLLDLSDRE